MDCFRVLGIEQTKEEGKLKQAYLQKLKVTNPEDDPEGFKRLRKAYEEAVAYARHPEEDQQPEQEEIPVDNTPSGQWVRNAGKIYGKLSTRTDLNKWKELFGEEVFLSLDGEDECREKLLVFLMNHIYLPTSVWKLLDEKLHISGNQNQLKEKFPAEFIRYLFYKCHNGENIDFELFQGADDANYDEYLNLYNQGWRMLDAADISGAEDAVTHGEELSVSHPAMQLLLVNIRLKQGRKDEALQRIQQLRDDYPDEGIVVYQAAELYFQMGETEKAKSLYEKLKEQDHKHYMANFRLTKIYTDEGQYKQAKKCAECVLQMGADDDFISQLQKINAVLEKEYKEKKDMDSDAAMEYGWCLIQDERYYEGIKLAESLEGKIRPERDAERKGLLAKLYLQEAMFQEALDQALIWREALRKRIESETKESEDYRNDRRRFRDSYLVRVEAFYGLAMGKKDYYEDALKELDAFEQMLDEKKDAEELLSSRIRIRMKRAEIYLEQDEDDRAEEIAMQLVDDYHLDAAYTILLRLFAKKRDAGGVIHFGQLAVKSFPQYARAYEEMALVYLCLKRGEDLAAVLEDARKAEVKSVYLDAYEYQYHHPVSEEERKSLRERLNEFEEKYKKPIVEWGRISKYEEGIQELMRIFYQAPSTYMLNEVGRFQMDSLHFEEAEETFKKILEEKPGDQFALNNLGCVYKYTEQYEKAIVALRKAMQYMDAEPNVYPYGNLGHTYERMGEYESAYQTYVALDERFPDRASTPEDLMHTLTRSGKPEQAVAICEKEWPTTEPALAMDRLTNEFDIYMEVGNMEPCGKLLEEMEQVYNRKTMEQFSDYGERKVQYLILSGKYLEGLSLLKKVVFKVHAACPEGIKNGRRTSMARLIAQYLFLLTLYDDAVKEEEKPVRKGLLQKIKDLQKKTEKGEKLTHAERRAGFFQTGETYRQWLEDFLKKNEEMYRDLFFYQKSYLAYFKFINAYFNPDADVEAALQEMNHSIICRMCRDHGCVERMVANALMLERKGDRQGAMEAYRRMDETNPFHLFARAKLLYMQ